MTSPADPSVSPEKSSASVRPEVILDSDTNDALDGGLLAWSQVLSSFFIYFATWGFIQTFGVYQSYYETTLLSSNTPSEISWIGSTESFLLVAISMISGPVFDRGYARELVAVGGFLVTFGTMMTSLSDKYYQVMLSQGICTGLGHGCLWVPSMAMVSVYFDQKRPLALGISSTGGAVGGVLFPIIFHKLQPSVGFPWAVRTIAFITFALLVVAFVLMKPKSAPDEPRPIWDISALHDAPFVTVTVASVFILIGAWVPWFYIQVYALREINTDTQLTFYLLPIASASSILGRLLPPALSLKTGPFNMLIICSASCAILCFCWIAVKTVAGIIVFSLLYGHFVGATVGLSGAVIASITPDSKLVGTRMGMCLGIAAVGLLVGNPVAGALVNTRTGNFHRMQIFTGGVLAGGTMILSIAAIWIMRIRGTLRV